MSDPYANVSTITPDPSPYDAVSTPVNDNAPQAQPQSTSQALGFEQGVGRFLGNAATVGDTVGRKIGLPMDKIENAVLGGKTFDQARTMLENPVAPANTAPGAWGRAGADMIEGAPLYAVAGPLAGGALTGGMTSNSNTPTGVATDAVIGGIAGKATDAAMGAVKSTLAPKISPYVKTLLDAKIPLTAGQTIGGAFQQIENKATSLPLIGDAISGAQNRATQGLNRAVANRALAPIGQSLPADVPVGREAVAHVGGALGDNYDALLPNLSGKADPKFVSDMQGVIAKAQSDLPDAQYNQFKKIIETQISGKADPSGAFDGQSVQGINSTLKKAAQGYKSDPQFDNRQLGQSLGDAHSAFRDMIGRSNPDAAAELAATDQGYANFATMRRAASSVGAEDGVFTAAQLQNAVKAGDRSAGKGAFARGDARMQDLSDAAKNVMVTTPDSGTAGRLTTAAMIGEGLRNPHLAIGALAAGPIYSKTGQAAIRSLASGNRGQVANYASKVTALARAPASIAASALSPALISSKN